MWNREPVGGPFALIDHDRQAAHRRRLPRQADADLFRLHLSAPTYARPTCRRSACAMDKLGSGGEAVQPLFITVDPEKRHAGAARGLCADCSIRG